MPLDNGLYAGSKTYTAYDQYLNDNGALFKLNPSVALGYTINTSTYPLAKDDPNLIPYSNFESASTEAIDEFNNITAPEAIDKMQSDANAAVSSAISALSLADIGNYEDDETFNNYNEYVVFERSTNPTRWRVNGNVTLPYTVNSSIDPSADPNLYGSPTFLTIPEPDVSLPFDNTIVEKLSGALSFSRASTRSNTNQSGVVETIAVDEPGITKNGISIYESYTNEVLWSEDFTKQAWSATDAVLTQNYGVSPDGFQNSTRAQGSAAQGVKQIQSTTPGVTYTSQFYVKGVAGESVQLSAGSSATGEFILTGDWDLIGITGVTSDNNLRCYLLLKTALDVEVWGAQLTEGERIGFPYIKTEEDAATSAPDIATISVAGNMPKAGDPFTIMCDADFSDSPIFSKTFELPSGTGAISTNGDHEYFQLTDTGGTVVYSGISGGRPQGVHRRAAVYDGSNIKYYRDGVLISSASFPLLPKYGEFLTSTIGIGSDFDGGENIANTEVKNFKIYHRALSDDQIAALGFAE